MAAVENGGGRKANHLCVLVHGLWGNPEHMRTIAEQLREKYSEDRLRILITATNAHYNTYDGIEVGGERVAAEIEAELRAAEDEGGRITRFSILGYSLGGLVARYCVGLLYARGHFDAGRLEPVLFTTMASPHLGVRAPVRWFGTNVWNTLGANTLSVSGQQMFVADRFRDTGRPLLLVMSDPSSIFHKALSVFRRRVLYANVVNDRSVPFYTSAISAVDPFVDPDAVDMAYIPGYAPTLLDLDQPVVRRPAAAQPDLYTRVVGTAYRWLTRLPLLAALVTLMPITGSFFIANAGYQTFRSSGRIRAHTQLANFSSYRVPLLLEQALNEADGAAAPQYLSEDEAEDVLEDDDDGDVASHEKDHANGKHILTGPAAAERARHMSGIDTDRPALALMPEQFQMVHNLSELGWRKFPVHITLVTHSHAAIIVRWKKDGFREGYAVIRHWIDEEFEI